MQRRWRSRFDRRGTGTPRSGNRGGTPGGISTSFRIIHRGLGRRTREAGICIPPKPSNHVSRTPALLTILPISSREHPVARTREAYTRVGTGSQLSLIRRVFQEVCIRSGAAYLVLNKYAITATTTPTSIASSGPSSLTDTSAFLCTVLSSRVSKLVKVQPSCTQHYI